MQRLTAIAPLIVLISISGCRTRDLEWDIRFEPASSSAMARVLEAQILRGPCPGTTAVYQATIFPGTPPAPPELAEGTWCFSARAGNATCQWFAEGGTTVALPADDESERVTITLTAAPPMSNCMGVCEDGACRTAPPPDGGAPDSGGVCIGLAQCMESCPVGNCARTCEDTSRCTHTCEGGLCTDRCTDASQCGFDCDGGNCRITCSGASACTATCASGNCTMECSDFSSCNFSCDGGNCEFVCGPGADCTTSCNGGNCTGG